MKIGLSPLMGFALGFEISDISFERDGSVEYGSMFRIYLFLFSINIVVD
jgi:hypothetical protein|tara:strand:+ start:398 stop:544 length:147 start_codon:yes stop_codon:yes gene_type:complete